MSNLSTLRLFTTPEHACSYLEDHQASTLFIDPHARINTRMYSELSDMGFRRSGDYVYRPHCRGCNACIPARVDVKAFIPSRRHRRVLQKNSTIQVDSIRPCFTRELYQLYSRYIERRHQDGDMYPPSQEQYASFLMSSWSDTWFHCFRTDGKLVAVAVTDRLDSGFSAVYTFFDPDLHDHSLGALAVLWQIQHAVEEGLDWLYLGYWISGCRKMRYKQDYQPLELLVDEQWQPMTTPGVRRVLG